MVVCVHVRTCVQPQFPDPRRRSWDPQQDREHLLFPAVCCPSAHLSQIHICPGVTFMVTSPGGNQALGLPSALSMSVVALGSETECQDQGHCPPALPRAGCAFKSCRPPLWVSSAVVPGTIAHTSLPCIIVCPAGRRTPGGKAVFLSSLHPPSTQLVLSALKTEDTLLTSHLPPPPASLLLFFWVFRAPSSQVLMCSLQIACIWKTLTSKLHLGMSQKIHVFLVHGIKAK